MHIVVHGEGTGQREHEAEQSSTVAALLAHLGHDAESLLWVEDSEVPARAESTLAEAGIAEFTHVHASRCRGVLTTVRFGGESKEHSFSPAATVQTVFVWAAGRSGFNLPAEQRAKHTLGLCGTQAEADRRDHVGSIATECRVCFDLAPKVRYQG